MLNLTQRNVIKELAIKAGFEYDQGNLYDPGFTQWINKEVWALAELILNDAEYIKGLK